MKNRAWGGRDYTERLGEEGLENGGSFLEGQ
jgi:hypothetical protein